MQVWAFNKADDAGSRQLVYESVKAGKSRFGWSQRDEHDLGLKDNWTDWHSKQLFLLQIRERDWIVHINTPVWGKCIAARVLSEYAFDEGLACDWGYDFRHCFEVDVSSVTEFDRRDPNVLPSVNLRPRQRYHRIYAVDDFLESIANLREGRVDLCDGERREEYHLKDKTSMYLSEITRLIHETHRGKNLERFLAKVFRGMPAVVDVNENGFGWGTDHGADLIVTLQSALGNLQFDSRIIVQVKSFEDSHRDTEAVEQVREGINKYSGTAGMVITTGEKTEELENKIGEVSNELGCSIALLAGEDVARFVVKNAPELLFRLDEVP
mgnify:CR=1 FL=1